MSAAHGGGIDEQFLDCIEEITADRPPERPPLRDAKCVVIDERATIAGSFRLSERWQERNIKAGLLVRDAQIASRLAVRHRTLTRTGEMRPLPQPLAAPTTSAPELDS